MNHTLEVDGVILEFGRKRVLQDVYLKCSKGEITGLLGRNGCGKTCLMNILYGNLTPENQSVRINGEVILKKYRPSSQMMFLPQFSFIPKYLTIRRIFKDFKLDFEEFITEFPEFSKYRKSKLRKLSGGEQRIIEIYLILAAKTEFCLLDEPFSHIMPVHIETIKRLIVREKQNKGMLITDHLYQHIVELSDRLYLINDGKTFLVKNIGDIESLGYAHL